MNYWQIAAGSAGRDYAPEFLRYGMAFVGGGTHAATMAGVEVGDRVILKRGMSEIVAVGEVVERDGKHLGKGDRDWLCDFDGWDLSAYCFVDWHVPDETIAVRGLTRTTIQNVHKPDLKATADKVITTVPKKGDYDPEPRETNKVKDPDILKFLIAKGLRPGAAEDLTVALKRIRLLATYYYDNIDWEEVREHETRTFLVVPLLIALGWAEQQIKIELPVPGAGRADLACFQRPYSDKNKDHCVLLIETKGFSQGLTYAPEQARAYAKYFPTCEVVLVTNGYCYKAFTRDESKTFAKEPRAYLNLRDPRGSYPLKPDKVDGALEVLRLLLPSSFMGQGNP